MIRSHHFSAILPATEVAIGFTPTEWLTLLKAAVNQAELTSVGELAVTFQPQGASVILILEESHVALHIWPETGKVTADIHICDYHRNNLPKAEKLTDLLAIAISGNNTRIQWSYLSASG